MNRIDRLILRSGALSVALVLSFCSVRAEANIQSQAWVSSPQENPGFEGQYQQVSGIRTGITGRVAVGWRDYSYGNVNAHYDEQTSNPHGGKTCQQVTVDTVGTNSCIQIGQLANVVGGRVYFTGIWLRGTPGMHVTILLRQAASPGITYESTPVEVSQSWQLVSIPEHVVKDGQALFAIQVNSPGTLCIDDATIMSAESSVAAVIPYTSTQESFGMHITDYLESEGPRNLDFEDSFEAVVSSSPTVTGQLGKFWLDNSYWTANPISADYEPNLASPHGGRSDQKVNVRHIDNGAVQIMQRVSLRIGQTYKSSIWIKATAGMVVNFGLRKTDAPYTRYGWTNTTANGLWQQLSVEGAVTDTGGSSLVLLTSSLGELEFDDVRLLNAGGAEADLSLPWPAVPFGTWRVWDQVGVTWDQLEPARGKWDFTLLDKAVADAAAHRAKVVVTLGQSPSWASARPHESLGRRPGAAAEPADMKDWTDYLKAVAARYRGEVFYYELWNEPNASAFFSGSTESLVQLARAAQETLKDVDPNIQLIGPAAVSSLGYLQEFLAAGGRKYVDIISVHLYSYANAPEEDARILADVRTMLANAGVSDKQIWVTEGAVGTSSTSDDVNAAGLVARKFLVDLTYGANRLIWYSWGPSKPYCLGTTKADGIMPNLAGNAIGVLEGWMVGRTVTGGSVDAVGNWVVQIDEGTRWRGYIVWNPNGEQRWAAPTGVAGYRIHTLTGGTTITSASTLTVGQNPQLIEPLENLRK